MLYHVWRMECQFLLFLFCQCTVEIYSYIFLSDHRRRHSQSSEKRLREVFSSIGFVPPISKNAGHSY